MSYTAMREELKRYYWQGTKEISAAFKEKAFKVLDASYVDGMSPYDMKVLQYKTITDLINPVLFFESPYYYETGTMWAHCDGARGLRGVLHAGGWTHWKNQHLFIDQDKELYELHCSRTAEQFYTTCGIYNDSSQHFNFDTRPILKIGLKGLYEKAKEGLKTAQEPEEIEYLNATCEAMLCLKKIGEKFSLKAKEMLLKAETEEQKANLTLIADTASRVPWEKPETLYEALNTYAFMRKTLGSLEGVGPNTFGRLDMDLYPFYEKDIECGILTK